MEKDDRKRVMCFGTFDGLHAGHRFLLNEAAKNGRVRAVVALDATVQEVKGHPPVRDQETRRRAVEEAGFEAVLGRPGDKYEVIRAYRPHLICLGYDQETFTGALRAFLEEEGIGTEIVRLPAYRPEIYRSSLLDAEKRTG